MVKMLKILIKTNNIKKRKREKHWKEGEKQEEDEASSLSPEIWLRPENLEM